MGNIKLGGRSAIVKGRHRQFDLPERTRIGAFVPPELVKLIDAEAARRLVSRSWIIAEAIEERFYQP